jgi:PleD family two-component response regulator
MPEMNGFEFCTAIRSGGPNADTPVVFITSHKDVEVQAQAAACGGNDFIGKPFLPIEITVKALTFAWEGRLRRLSSTPPLEHGSPVTKEQEPAPALVAA